MIFILLAVLVTGYPLLAQTGDFPGYGGPAVASRGMQTAGVRGGAPLEIRPYASVTAVYDDGVIGVGLDKNGNITDPGALYGIEANVGAYGTHQWKRTRLGLDYQGLYRHYNQKTYWNGSDHLISLDFARQLTRRSTLVLRTMGGTSSRAVGGVFGYGSIDPAFQGIPIRDIFDNRSYFVQTIGQYVLQLGARNSFSVGGDGFVVARQSKALNGVKGYRVFADFARRLSRRQTLGVVYQYFHMDYSRAFAEGDAQMLALNFSRQFGRNWQLVLAAGGSRVDSAGIRVVTLDPVVAELLGRTAGREAFNRINYVPSIQGSILRKFRHSSLSFGYSRGVYSGNGVLLVSRTEDVHAIYSYNSGRRWSLSGNAGYYSVSGFGSYGDRFRTGSGGTLFSYRIWENVYFTGGYDLRRVQVTTSGFHRFGSRLTGGLTYSPGEIPVWIR
ncbi:MAG: hypothetical protein HY235_19535 [Acidobacteria bacterium]|nr:hypothetical protein [Acidobacteriota bacterium]